MDMLFTAGIYFIELLQKRLGSYDEIIPLVSHIFDPKYAYSIYFSVVFAFSRLCGYKLLYATVISEYLNMMLKWIIQEDRPYWWVKENADKVFNVTITQFPNTCETGPGSPSGHVMIATTVWYIVVASLSEKLSNCLKFILWILYYAVITLIAVSRMFVAAHFPHQCVLGFIIGIAIGRSCTKMNENKFKTTKLLLVSAVLMSTTLSLYNALDYCGLDPNRSVTLAVKWCSNQKNIHLDTTPLFCATRYTGALAGLAVGNFKANWSEKLKSKSILLTLSGLGISFMFWLIPYPTEKALFYYGSLVLHFSMQLFIARVGPEIIVRITPHSEIHASVIKKEN